MEPPPGSKSSSKLAHHADFSACTMCTNFCFANHQSNDHRSLHHEAAASAVAGADQMQLPPPSFIKIILDRNEDDRSRFLRIPSLFMEQHGYRIDDKVTLEGPTGFSCQVPLLAFNNGFGLRAGFRAFSDYHGIQSGDSVIFNLTRNSHFVLKIYAKLGCQKTAFPGDMKDPQGNRFNEQRFSKHRCVVYSEAAHSHESDQVSDYRKKLRNSNVLRAAIGDRCKLPAGRKRKVPEPEEEEKDGSFCKRRNGGFTCAFREEPSGSGSLNGPVQHGDAGFSVQSEEEKLDQSEMMQRFLERPELFFERLPTPLVQEKPPGKNPPPTSDNEGKDKRDSGQRPAKTMQALKPRNSDEKQSPGPHGRAATDEFLENQLSPKQNRLPNRRTSRWKSGVSGRSGVQTDLHGEHIAQQNMFKSAKLSAESAGNIAGRQRHQREPSQFQHYTSEVPEGLLSEAESLTMYSGPSQTQLGGMETCNKQEMVKVAKGIKSKNPLAIIFISKTYVNSGCPIVPKAFSSKWLPANKTKIRLVDMSGKKWPVVYNPCGPTARFQKGWLDFAEEQSLKEGDICVFELKNPNRMNVSVHILRLEDYVASMKGWRHSTIEARGEGKASQEDVTVLERRPPRAKKQAGKFLEFDPGCTSNDSCDKNDVIRSARLPVPNKTREISTCSEEGKLASPLLDPLTESTTIARYIASLRNTGIAESKEKMLSFQRGGKDSNKDSDNQKMEEERVPATKPQEGLLTGTRSKRSCVQRNYKPVEWSKAMNSANALRLKNPHDVVTLTDVHVLNLTISLPSLLLGMPDITTEATLVDSAGNLYPAIWKPRLNGGSLTSGWSTFVSDHCLQAGDVCVFEVTNFTELIISVHIFRRDDDNNRPQNAFANRELLGRLSSPSTSLQSKSIHGQDKTSQDHHFVKDHSKVAHAFSSHHPISEEDKCRAILAAYKFKVQNPSFTVCNSENQHSVLSIPTDFAKLWMPQKLAKSTLVDSLGYTWTATWTGNTGQPCLTGWSSFSDAHGLQEGDVCVLELTNPSKLIFKVHIFSVLDIDVKKLSPDALHDQYQISPPSELTPPNCSWKSPSLPNQTKLLNLANCSHASALLARTSRRAAISKALYTAAIQRKKDDTRQQHSVDVATKGAITDSMAQEQKPSTTTHKLQEACCLPYYGKGVQAFDEAPKTSQPVRWNTGMHVSKLLLGSKLSSNLDMCEESQ